MNTQELYLYPQPMTLMNNYYKQLAKSKLLKLAQENKLGPIMEKKFYHSRTFWISVLEIVAGISTALAGELTLGVTLTGAGIVQLILRVITRSSLIR